MIYKPDIRINNPIYLLKQVEELLKIATFHKNSSSLIYASLECRIALEIMDLNFILHSVSANEREQIIIDSKPKNGIDRVNKTVGVLKQQYQVFLQAVCELMDVENVKYDFKKSKDLQYKVSTYIHSYHMTNKELEYDSENMENCKNLILEVDKFIKSSLPEKEETYTMLGIEIAKMPEEDKKLLNKWKTSSKMSYEELKETLSKNKELRRTQNE